MEGIELIWKLASGGNLIPLNEYDFKNESYMMSDGSYMDIIKIAPRDLVNSKPEEIGFDIYVWIKKFQTYADDIKIYLLNYPINVESQIGYFSEKIKNTNNKNHKKWLNLSKEELEVINSHGSRKFFAMMIFGETVERLTENRIKVKKALHIGSSNKIIEEIEYREKQNILFKIFNKNLKVDENRELESITNHTRKNMMKEIMPRGKRISFKNERYITNGNSYETCIRILTLPKYVRRFWLKKIHEIEDCVVVIDVASEDKNAVKKALNKSIAEQGTRLNSPHSDYAQKADAQYKMKEMSDLYSDIMSVGEIIKLIQIRIFIADNSLSSLEDRVKEIMIDLDADEFQNTIYIGELYSEYESLMLSYEKQKQTPLFFHGLPVTATALSEGMFFNYSELLDYRGSYLGSTSTGGAFLFNPFIKTKTRKSYSGIVVGDLGAGKSVFLKKMGKDNSARGNYSRYFDISGENAELVEDMGGVSIDCFGSMLNFLEFYKYSDNEVENYTRHIAKCKAIYRILRPDVMETEITKYSLLLKGMYEELGFTSNSQQLTGLSAESYPILSDLLKYTEKELQRTISSSDRKNSVNEQILKDEALILNNIKNFLEEQILNYGTLLNGHSSMINIIDIKDVNFDMSKLKDLDSQIFDAVVFNMIMLCQDGAVTNGKIMMEKIRKGEIRKEDAIKTIIIIDESHRWVGIDKPHLLSILTAMIREARKFFIGYWFAGQNIRDYVPQGNASSESNAKAIGKLKALFELMVYQVMMAQSTNAVEHIKTIFGNSMTESQIERIPYLGEGEAIVVIGKEQSIEVSIHLTEMEQYIFNGGV